MRVKSLQDLKPVRKALAAAARQAALIAEEQRRIALRPAGHHSGNWGGLLRNPGVGRGPAHGTPGGARGPP
ncbi:MAG: hypothetical protein RSC66_08545, partial [Comamonas sp.]